jgi:hypothetical protein
LPGYLEIFTLEGALHPEGEGREAGMTYYFYPPEEPVGPLVAGTEVFAYVNFGRPLEG